MVNRSMGYFTYLYGVYWGNNPLFLTFDPNFRPGNIPVAPFIPPYDASGFDRYTRWYSPFSSLPARQTHKPASS